MTTDQEARINQITLVGMLDTQRRRGKDTLLTSRYNRLGGRGEQVSLQLLSPYGTPFRQVVHLEGPVVGRELLDDAAQGALLAVEGVLEWTLTTDPRYALSPLERGRQSSEITIRARAIRLATVDDELGADVWLRGRVLTPIRTLRHPEKPLRIAATTLQITQTQTRKGSRACLVEQANVPVTIPLDHPDAERLFRPGNEVIVEGMLERVMVLLNGQDVERAVTALDQEWHEEREALAASAIGGRQRDYARQRWRLLEGARTRVVAGYVELIAGTPATLAEGLTIRRQQQRQRRTDRREREVAKERAVGGAEEPGAVALGTEPAADTIPAGKPRRRVESEVPYLESSVDP